MRRRLIIVLLHLAGAWLHAGETPPAYTHRVIGLFDHGREAEFRAALDQIPEVKLVALDFDYAEATFNYNPNAIRGLKRLSVVQRLNDALRQVSNHTFGLRERMEAPREKLVRVDIPIAGLDCRGCSFGAYRAVMDIDGVAQATSSFKDGRLSALIDPAKTSREALVTALKKAGVTVEEKK